jgi:protein TonB
MKSIVKKSEKNLVSNPDRRKKSEKADLESKKAIFFQIGLIIALSIALFAFEWKSYDKFNLVLDTPKNEKPIEILPPITKIEKPEPKIEKPNLTLITVVDKIDDKDDEFDPFDKFDETKVNEPYIPVTKLPDPEPEIDEIFIVVENEPMFVGGEAARIDFLRKNIVYPQIAREAGIQGIVFTTFVIEKNGMVSDVKILRGIGGGCDEESLRVIKAMPRWNPGLQRGKAVRVQFNMPIKFTLSN